MPKNNTQKLIRTTEEIALLITELSKELDMSESKFISELVRNYAIDCSKIDGVKNYSLIEQMTVPTYENKRSQKELTDDLSQLKRELRTIRTILNGLDQYGYITRDALNAILQYLKPEDSIEFGSTDTKMSLTNKKNVHSFLEKSADLYAERIRREQIENSGK